MVRRNSHIIGVVLVIALASSGYALYQYRQAKGAVLQKGVEILSLEDKKTLEQGETFTLYRLRPQSEDGERETNERGATTASKKLFFHTYEALWKPTPIRDVNVRSRILASIYRCIRDGDIAKSASCFNPRHAIHSQQGKRSVDIVLCFECGNGEIFVDDVKKDCAITDAPKALLDEALSH